MASYWIWWIIAGALVAAELVTGTFYLAALGVAFVIGGIAALAGASFEIQLAVAAAFAIAGTFAAHRWRTSRATPPQDPAFDIGQTVRVQAWNPDGTARVAYRGTSWLAEPATPSTRRAETMYIVALRGSTLVIASERP
ncbi:MAG TPA: NfeD family protein [Casimicrobiaceae bacterium]|nr:NfeD family protein [Casimicrobiaceae bacterium]